MPTTTHISDAMRSIVGRPYNQQVSFPIDASDIRRWAIATYYPEEPPRLFWDEAYARTTRFGGIVAPEEFNPFAWMVASPAGLKKTAVDPSVPHALRTELGVEGQHGVKGPGLLHMLNGGAELLYPGPRMRPGDVITSVTRIAEYSEKEGRLGLMLFTISETDWTNQHGELVKRSRNTLIRY